MRAISGTESWEKNENVTYSALTDEKLQWWWDRKQLQGTWSDWHYSSLGLGAGSGMPEGPSAGKHRVNETNWFRSDTRGRSPPTTDLSSWLELSVSEEKPRTRRNTKLFSPPYVRKMNPLSPLGENGPRMQLGVLWEGQWHALTQRYITLPSGSF